MPRGDLLDSGPPAVYKNVIFNKQSSADEGAMKQTAFSYELAPKAPYRGYL